MNSLMKRLMSGGMALNVFVYRRSGGRWMSRGGGGVPLLLLTMTGRRTGKSRTIPLGYLEDDGGYVVCGSAGGAAQDPAWVHNLRANPAASVELGTRMFDVSAEELVGDAYEPTWQRFSAGYPNYAAYTKKTSRRLPLFSLVPTSPLG